MRASRKWFPLRKLTPLGNLQRIGTGETSARRTGEIAPFANGVGDSRERKVLLVLVR